MSSLSGPNVVDIPLATEESSGNYKTEDEKAVTLATAPASAPSTLGSGEKPVAWVDVNWSRSSSKGGHSHQRSRSMSETSFSSCSETSRTSVDLFEELNVKEVFVPTIALLPNIVTEVAASSGNAHNTSNMSASVNNPFQRRPAESSSNFQSWFRFFGNNHSAGRVGPRGDTSGGITNLMNSNNLPRQTRSYASITARSRRSLLFLFLIAAYTTFGLTVHNLPVPPELEFTGLHYQSAAVSADFLSEQADARLDAEVKTVDETKDVGSSQTATSANKKHSIKNQIAFARRAKQKIFFRPKEVNDFYQQQALAGQVDYSFFVNCGVLALVVFWAWRERHSMSYASSPGLDDEPDMVV